jgi:integrase
VQWKRGHAEAFNLRAENTKTGAARTIPKLGARLKKVLKDRRKDPDGNNPGPAAYVFGNEVGERIDSVKTAWKGTCARPGITGLTFHDLRRECGSRMLSARVNLLTVSRLLGHKSLTTTNTYLTADELLAAKELGEYHPNASRNYPRITLVPKPKPPVEGKATRRELKKSSTLQRFREV